jgi:phospholipase/carboxylesterase
MFHGASNPNRRPGGATVAPHGGPSPIDSIVTLLAPLLDTLERIVWVQRYLHPPVAARLADELAPCSEALSAPLRELENASWPEDLHFLRDRLFDVSRQTLELVDAFATASRDSGEIFDLYRALRRFARIQEGLYPLAPVLEPISRWFLEPARRGDDALVARLRDGTLRDDDSQIGVLHARNARDTRGGFSLYVPETWDNRSAMALVVALHGGHGHGRDFLWNWLREARSRGVMVVAPTSRDRTWSLMGEDVDAPAMQEIVNFACERYPVDRGRVLLTGMSDGGTYTLLAGLRQATPYTHLAPACGVLHPLLLGGDLAGVRERHIYLVHGALDWMFPVATARIGRDALQEAGARLVYREIADLSHTYPREENPKILDWLLA